MKRLFTLTVTLCCLVILIGCNNRKNEYFEINNVRLKIKKNEYGKLSFTIINKSEMVFLDTLVVTLQEEKMMQYMDVKIPFVILPLSKESKQINLKLPKTWKNVKIEKNKLKILDNKMPYTALKIEESFFVNNCGLNFDENNNLKSLKINYDYKISDKPNRIKSEIHLTNLERRNTMFPVYYKIDYIIENIIRESKNNNDLIEVNIPIPFKIFSVELYNNTFRSWYSKPIVVNGTKQLVEVSGTKISNPDYIAWEWTLGGENLLIIEPGNVINKYIKVK